MAELQFFFDYGSPYSYLANTQLASLRERTGCTVSYRPMLLGGVFKATGNVSPAFEKVEPKRAYGAADMQRWIALYGVAFRTHPNFPLNTLGLMRLAHAALKQGCFEAFHAAVYPAFWAEARDMSAPDEQRAVLGAAGLDAEALLAAAQEPGVKDSLRATTDEAVARGVFGAPTFFVGDAMFFGNDRLAFVERALGA